MDVTEVHAPLCEPRRHVEHAHPEALVEVLAALGVLVREGEPRSQHMVLDLPREQRREPGADLVRAAGRGHAQDGEGDDHAGHDAHGLGVISALRKDEEHDGDEQQ